MNRTGVIHYQVTKIVLRTGKEIRFRFGSSEDKADTASRSRSQPKMEDNLFTSPYQLSLEIYLYRRS
jgi:hypothetical protein